jgi:hypothetical protein
MWRGPTCRAGDGDIHVLLDTRGSDLALLEPDYSIVFAGPAGMMGFGPGTAHDIGDSDL